MEHGNKTHDAHKGSAHFLPCEFFADLIDIAQATIFYVNVALCERRSVGDRNQLVRPLLHQLGNLPQRVHGDGGVVPKLLPFPAWEPKFISHGLRSRLVDIHASRG